MAEKVAIIDLGTNTFNLLIAKVEEDSFEVLYHTKLGVALGMGGINSQQLHPHAIDRALDALRQYKATCEQYNVSKIRAFGTSAIRDAKNGENFQKQVRETLGIEIQIISGEHEAELIYKGVQWSYDYQQPALIMDIGGGSTEFVLADKQGVQKSVSLNIGVSRIFQQLHLSDPLTAENITEIESWLEHHTGELLDGFECPILIGSSGTFETLHELYFQKDFPKSNKCIEMQLHQLEEVLQGILKSTLEQRKQNSFIIPIRQMMIPIAAVKIKWILEKLNIQQLLISPYSLKEGALKH